LDFFTDEILTAILPLAFVAAALVDVRPDGAKLRVACLELDAAAFFFAGAFLAAVVELYYPLDKMRNLFSGVDIP
jgi:hypothetical protein